MKVLKCSCDGCDTNAELDIWTDTGDRLWLCEHHADQARESDWITFPVNGETLMRDTAGSWFWIPDADTRPTELARLGGLI